MRHTEARYRHIVWVASLVLGLILPLMSPGRIGRDKPALKDGIDLLQARSSVSKDGEGVTEPGTQAFTSATIPSSRFDRALACIKEPISVPPFLVRIVLTSYLVWILLHSLNLARALKRTREACLDAEQRPLPDWMEPVVSRCRAEFGLRRVTILYSSRAFGPITVGARRPVIILPDSLFQPSAADDLSAALSHEMAHIRRHDFSLNLLYEFLFLPLSFHPAARLVRRRLDETREIACDEMAASRVLNASTYARSLLSIALNMSRPPATAPAAGHGHTLGVFDANILEERIMRLLNKSPRISPRLGKASLVLALIVLAASFLGAAAFSLSPTQQEQTGSISGTVFDPSGARVPNAIVKLTEERTGKSLPTPTDDTGRFSFSALAFGKYMLEVSKPGFLSSSNHQVAIGPGNSTGTLGIVLYVGETLQMVIVGAKAPEGVQQQIPKKVVPQRIRIGGLVESAKLVKQLRPEYPESLRQKGIQGIVLMRAVISKEGVPIDWKVLSSPDPALSDAAVNAFKEWRYKPTLLNGHPVEVV